MEIEPGNNEIVTDAGSRYLSSVDDHSDTAGQLLKKRHTDRRWIIAGVLSLIAIVIAATLPFMGHDDDVDNSRTKLEKLQELQSILLNYSEPLAFVRPDSPSSQALQYLAYKQDQFALHARSEGQVLQLYALLVLLFTCGGYDDLLDDSISSECDIDYLTCDERGNLIGVDLSGQKLSDVLPGELALLTHLKDLDLRRNDVKGDLPSESLRTLTSLERLWLGSNKFVSSISPVMSELTNLLTLDVSNNNLTGSLPSALSKLVNLSESFLLQATSLKNLTHLDIDETDLGGTIPTEIGLLSNLSYFKIQLSKVRGSVPTEITKLTQLRQLLIDGPLFEGTLPNDIGRMTELDSISFTGNNLGGTIPTTIGLLSNLLFVRIGDSQIRGTIPTELGKCPKLSKLSFEISRLSGTLPAEFAVLGFLETIFLEYTAISVIPEEVCGTGVRIVSECDLRCSCCDHAGRC